MDINQKFKIVKYRYNYSNNKWNKKETKDFFDLDLVNLLCDNLFEINNISDLLDYFDMSEIFNDFNNGLSDIQNKLLKFLISANVKNVNKLLDNIPLELEFDFFYSFYNELCNRNNRSVNYYKIVSSLNESHVMEFINKTIDDVSDEEIITLIQELYRERRDNILVQLMLNERITNICVSRINSPFFYELLDELNLSNSMFLKREKLSKDILNNYQEYNSIDIKETYCDLYLRDTLKNVLLDLETILDFAKDDIIFKEEYLGEVYNYLYNLYNFLSTETIDSDFINDKIMVNYELLSKCFKLCQKRFKELLLDGIKKDVTQNIEPQILLSSSGEQVNCYNIDNQTNNQKSFNMLVSSLPISNSAKEFKEKYYSEQNGELKYKRRSCSLINQGRLNSIFGGNNRIIFGYDDLNGREITSATLGDGRTDGNEIRFRKKRKISKHSYCNIDKFISGTQGHNEIAVSMAESNLVMNPSYILVTKEPTQFEIDVASEFSIPIKFVNINNYIQESDNKYYSIDYDYMNFQRNHILSVNNLKLS